MNGRSYYNEIDPYAAQWLRNLIAAGHIAPGDVDERSIVDVRASDLAGYSQCHFFAGIGGWSLALRLAGWPDDRPVWTGSCPCQPFSAAGAGKAADDGRHLWPAWLPLIAECRPPIVFGEQVEAAVGWGWLDAVFADLESEGYACGATVLPACGVGAPHIRQRLWFVGHSEGGDGRLPVRPNGCEDFEPARPSETSIMADAADERRQQFAGDRPAGLQPEAHGARGIVGQSGDHGSGARILADTLGEQREGSAEGAGATGRQLFADGGEPSVLDHAVCNGRGAERQHYRSDVGLVAHSDGTRGFWSDAEWIPCTDGKARPVGPGSFPLGHGIRNRASKLRAYGNAIVPQVAAEFIIAAKEAIDLVPVA